MVEINQGSMKFIAASIYLDIENEITENPSKIENIVHLPKGEAY